MRRILTALVLLPAAIGVFAACGGASDVAGSVASIKDPREALAASVQEMNEESYYLEYELDFPEDEAAASGTLLLVQRGDDTAVRVLADEGEFAIFAIEGEQYFCFGAKPPAEDSPIEAGCYRGDDEDDLSSGDLNGVFFDSTSIMDEIVGDEDARISDAPDRTVAGLEARCLDIEGPGNDAGTICIAKKTGLLVLIEGEFDGEPGRIQLVNAREPSDSDFELPFDVLDGPFNVFGSMSPSGDPDEPYVPEKPERDSIPSVRIAGPLFPWETTPALCPDFEIDESARKIAAYPGGRLLIQGPFSVSTLDSACAYEKPAMDAWTFAADRSGNVYLVDESGFDGARIVRLDASGVKTVIAGRACESRREGCDQHPDGPALDVVLGSVWDIAVSGDGTVWFTEWGTDADDPERLRRVTPGGRVETVDHGLDGQIWEIAGAAGAGLVVVADFDDAYMLANDGSLARLRLTGDSCFASGPDGVIWSYDSFEGALIATLPGGSSKAFPFQPEAQFGCASLSVEDSGDLLLLSASWGPPAGLWRIPNPLVTR